MKKRSVAFTLVSCLAVMLYAGAVCAQVDLSGNWAVESTQDGREHASGPFPGNFAGIPLNQQGREAGWAYSGDQHEELYRQCEAWSMSYLVTGPWGGTFTAVRDHFGNVVAWHLSAPLYDRLPNTIWMDGRQPPPPQAVHTNAGFTTGHWEGDTLVTYTTHLSDSILERNGPPVSNQGTVRLFITRHADELMMMGVIRDPVYLEAPWVKGQDFRLVLAGESNEVPEYCQPAEVVEGLSDGYHTATVLPDQIAAAQTYMLQHYGIPVLATQGGAQTMYPQFRKKLTGMYKTKTTYCTQFCCNGRGAQRLCKGID
jgi:hypothetical protein